MCAWWGPLGALVPVKGHIYLLQAFAALKDVYPQVQLAIIGKGREESRLLAEMSGLAWEDGFICSAFVKMLCSMCALLISGPCRLWPKGWAWRYWKG